MPTFLSMCFNNGDIHIFATMQIVEKLKKTSKISLINRQFLSKYVYKYLAQFPKNY